MMHAKDGADIAVIPALAIVCTKCEGSVAVVATEGGGFGDARAAALQHVESHGGQAFTPSRSDGLTGPRGQ